MAIAHLYFDAYSGMLGNENYFNSIMMEHGPKDIEHPDELKDSMGIPWHTIAEGAGMAGIGLTATSFFNDMQTMTLSIYRLILLEAETKFSVGRKRDVRLSHVRDFSEISLGEEWVQMRLKLFHPAHTIARSCNVSFTVQFILFLALAMSFWIAGTSNLSRHTLATLPYTEWGFAAILWMAVLSFSFAEILVLSARFNDKLSAHWNQKKLDTFDKLVEAFDDSPDATSTGDQRKADASREQSAKWYL